MSKNTLTSLSTALNFLQQQMIQCFKLFLFHKTDFFFFPGLLEGELNTKFFLVYQPLNASPAPVLHDHSVSFIEVTRAEFKKTFWGWGVFNSSFCQACKYNGLQNALSGTV